MMATLSTTAVQYKVVSKLFASELRSEAIAELYSIKGVMSVYDIFSN